MNIKLENVNITAYVDAQTIAVWFDQLTTGQKVEFFEHLWKLGDVRLSMRMAEVHEQTKFKTDQRCIKAIKIIGIYGADMSEYAEKLREARLAQIKDIAEMALNGADIKTALTDILKLSTDPATPKPFRPNPNNSDKGEQRN